MTTFYAIPSKLALGIPLISSLIADSKKSYKWYSPYSFLLNTNVFFSDVVLSNSNAGLKAYNLNSGKARVIYNGVRLSRFLPDYDTLSVREEFGIRTKFVVVMVAGFSVFKDYDLFVDVAKAIFRGRADVTFLGVGDGTEWKRIKRRVEDEGADNIILTGRQNFVERIVATADIGLLCTKAEGISNSIIEYMALGKPVIVTDVYGGSRELVSDGETGFCTERSVASVTGLINKLLDDPLLRENMGRKGKERIMGSFSISRMGEEFKTLYDEVLAMKK
jgi:glycosyltransferase involved in cell wall biosynthesis